MKSLKISVIATTLMALIFCAAAAAAPAAPTATTTTAWSYDLTQAAFTASCSGGGFCGAVAGSGKFEILSTISGLLSFTIDSFPGLPGADIGIATSLKLVGSPFLSDVNLPVGPGFAFTSTTVLVDGTAGPISLQFGGIGMSFPTDSTAHFTGSAAPVSPVSEAPTYAMLLAGVAGLGFVAHRKSVARNDPSQNCPA